MPEHDPEPQSPPERRMTPRRPEPAREGDVAWMQAQIAELWRTVNGMRQGHTDEQLRRIVREEVDAAMSTALPDVQVIRDLAPELVEMVKDHKRRRQEEAESAALWADWRARIDAAIKAIPQLFVLLGVLLTVAQLNRQGTVPNQAYWGVVGGVVLYGVWVVYGNLIRPAQNRPPQPPQPAPGDQTQRGGRP